MRHITQDALRISISALAVSIFLTLFFLRKLLSSAFQEKPPALGAVLSAKHLSIILDSLLSGLFLAHSLGEHAYAPVLAMTVRESTRLRAYIMRICLGFDYR